MLQWWTKSSAFGFGVWARGLFSGFRCFADVIWRDAVKEFPSVLTASDHSALPTRGLLRLLAGRVQVQA